MEYKWVLKEGQVGMKRRMRRNELFAFMLWFVLPFMALQLQTSQVTARLGGGERRQ